MHNTGMNTSSESIAQQQRWGPYQLRPNPKAILCLAFGTAVPIATFQVIPDFFSLLPSAPNLSTLLVWELGLWGFCAVYWITGFLCIVHLARIFGSAIVLDHDGIKLGRFDKKIEWKNIEALNVVERKVFSKVFFVPGLQMAIHYKKPNGKSTIKHLASFLFTKEEFFSLFYCISERSTGAKPSSLDAFVFKDVSNENLKKMADEGRLKRVVLTVFITLGLISFLGRKAATYYEYNYGNKEFALGNYDKAIAYYSTATAIDMFFSPAWDRLAKCEYRLGDLDSAEQHWKEALKWKPDLVESKIGLSQICMLRGNLDEAKEHLSKSIRLARYDEAAYINMAKLNSITGNNRLAIRQFEEFIKQKRGREQAIGILGDCYLREGEIEKAERLFHDNPSILQNPYSRPFCTMIMSELELAKGNTEKAAKLLGSVHSVLNSQPDLLINTALVEIAKGDLKKASLHLNTAEKLNPNNPWLALAKARLAFKADAAEAGSSNKICGGDGERWISLAVTNKYNDPCVFSEAALILDQNGKRSESTDLAKRCLEADPANIMAQRIMRKENKTEKPGG